jgi:hypothetical protein
MINCAIKELSEPEEKDINYEKITEQLKNSKRIDKFFDSKLVENLIAREIRNKMKIKVKKYGFLKFFEDLINPIKSKNYKLITLDWNNIEEIKIILEQHNTDNHIYNNSELWTEGDCILVQEDYFKYILKPLLKKRR